MSKIMEMQLVFVAEISEASLYVGLFFHMHSIKGILSNSAFVSVHPYALLFSNKIILEIAVASHPKYCFIP